MFKQIIKKLAALAIVGCVLATGAVAAGGGGGGGGGSTKPLTYRITGTIVNMSPVIGGVSITLGTSYYPVGTVIVTPDTKIKLNGSSSSVSVADLRLGDIAQIDYFWVSKFATKIEATGLR